MEHFILHSEMKLVVFVLNREELLDDVLAAYVEAGIPGATVLDSEGMGRYLTYEVPLFADFKEYMKGNKPYNKTILSVVRDERGIPQLKKLLDKITGGLSRPGTGILFSIPVDYAVGLIDTEEVEIEESDTKGRDAASDVDHAGPMLTDGGKETREERNEEEK